jgi:hypothetical protein
MLDFNVLALLQKGNILWSNACLDALKGRNVAVSGPGQLLGFGRGGDSEGYALIVVGFGSCGEIEIG